MKKEHYIDCSRELMATMLEERDDDIQELMSVIREIYQYCGEDPTVENLCNEVLESSRFEGL